MVIIFLFEHNDVNLAASKLSGPFRHQALFFVRKDLSEWLRFTEHALLIAENNFIRRAFFTLRSLHTVQLSTGSQSVLCVPVCRLSCLTSTTEHVSFVSRENSQIGSLASQMGCDLIVGPSWR